MGTFFTVNIERASHSEKDMSPLSVFHVDLPPPLNRSSFDQTPLQTHSPLRLLEKVQTGNSLILLLVTSSLYFVIDSLGGLIFSDQFIQIATYLPSENLYGFGENIHQTIKVDLLVLALTLF